MDGPAGDLPAVTAVVAIIIYAAWYIVAWRNRKGD
jgi:hypothetical protein